MLLLLFPLAPGQGGLHARGWGQLRTPRETRWLLRRLQSHRGGWWRGDTHRAPAE